MTSVNQDPKYQLLFRILLTRSVLMRRMKFAMAIVLLIGIILTGCQEREEEPPPQLSPTAIPSTQIPSPEPSPTETVVLPTPTSTPLPSSTATPKPSIPEDVALLSYRTLSQVEMLYTFPQAEVLELEFSPDGRYLRMRVPGEEDIYRDIIFDLEEGKEILSLVGNQRIYFKPESNSIVVLEGNSIDTINLLSGERKVEYTREYQAAALSPDGRLLVELEVHDQDPASTTLRLVDLPTETEIFWVYINATVEKDSLSFDDDGKYLAVSYFVPPGTSVATVWKADSGRVMYTEYGYGEIDLHPFGSEIAVASSRRSNISLISTVTWEQKLYLGSAEDEPGYYNVAYSSAGRLIYALSDREKTIASFWFPPSGEKIDLDLDLDLLAVTISPDRRYLATSDKSGSVIIWGVRE
jgi:WD40 repeat protein